MDWILVVLAVIGVVALLPIILKTLLFLLVIALWLTLSAISFINDLKDID